MHTIFSEFARSYSHPEKVPSTVNNHLKETLMNEQDKERDNPWLSPVESERKWQEEQLVAIFGHYPNASPNWQYMNGLIRAALATKEATKPEGDLPGFDLNEDWQQGIRAIIANAKFWNNDRRLEEEVPTFKILKLAQRVIRAAEDYTSQKAKELVVGFDKWAYENKWLVYEDNDREWYQYNEPPAPPTTKSTAELYDLYTLYLKSL